MDDGVDIGGGGDDAADDRIADIRPHELDTTRWVGVLSRRNDVDTDNTLDVRR